MCLVNLDGDSHHVLKVIKSHASNQINEQRTSGSRRNIINEGIIHFLKRHTPDRMKGNIFYILISMTSLLTSSWDLITVSFLVFQMCFKLNKDIGGE